MANHVRLKPGTYRAVTQVVVTLLHHSTETSYRTHKAGTEFEVPRTVSGFWHAATYYPDFGEQPPVFEAVNQRPQPTRTT